MKNNNLSKPGRKPVELSALVYHQKKWLIALLELAKGVPKRRELSIRYRPTPPTLTGDEEHDKEAEAKHAKNLSEGRDYRATFSDHRFRGIAPDHSILNDIFSPKTTTLSSMRRALSPLLFTYVPKLKKEIKSPDFVKDINDYARALLTAKEYRFPHSERPTSMIKKLIHCANALAGVDVDREPATAIDLLRKMRHGKRCPCAVCLLERERDFDSTVLELQDAHGVYAETVVSHTPLRWLPHVPKKKIGMFLFTKQTGER